MTQPELEQLAELLQMLGTPDPAERAAVAAEIYRRGNASEGGTGNPFASLLGVGHAAPCGPPADTPWVATVATVDGRPRFWRQFLGHTLTVQQCPVPPGVAPRWRAAMDGRWIEHSTEQDETTTRPAIYNSIEAATIEAELVAKETVEQDASYEEYLRTETRKGTASWPTRKK